MKNTVHPNSCKTKTSPETKRIHIVLAGNPNAGKSTVFNALTGMHQHTGNWSGKTVSSAAGTCRIGSSTALLADLPGTYSLIVHSAEEEAAREYLLREKIDLTVVVCDASALERNLNLVLQIMEISPRTLLCLNMMDEARRKYIRVDPERFAALLNIPAIGICAQRKRDILRLRRAMDAALTAPLLIPRRPHYPAYLEDARELLLPHLSNLKNARWHAMRILDGCCDPALLPLSAEDRSALSEITGKFHAQYPPQKCADDIAFALVEEAERICREAEMEIPREADRRDRLLDRFFTGKLTAFPVMLLLLFFIFWITAAGANVPSDMLSALFASFELPFYTLLCRLGLPDFLCELTVYGIYRMLTWVIAVMLPPMAIFFPLFTLLEDAGFLPRIAYNMDRCFHKCRSCGKQALTMCMGFGCNAVGVSGCRIMDSPRDRLIAILTNSFVPCNGRFPLLITLTSLFLCKNANSFAEGALFLTGIIVFSAAVSLLVSFILSHTVLRGLPSSFVLELPPYRRPVIHTVLIRSLLDRTLFVLGRAAAVAAPAGLLIWILANTYLGGSSLFAHISGWLDPIGRFLGMDGIILLAFILGFPANETVIPIMLMGYLSGETLVRMDSLSSLHALLSANGWTPVTAVCVILFSLMHWPCSTTLITIHRETGSIRWTLLALLLPVLCGFFFCAVTAFVSRALPF